MGPATGIAELRSFLLDMVRDGRGEDAIELVLRLIKEMRDDNNAKALRIAKLLRERYGRKGEKITAKQLDLFIASLKDAAGEEEVESSGKEPPDLLPPAPTPEPRRRKRTGRNPLPESLPRRVVEVEPTPAERCCERCGKAKACIGHETSELLEFVEAHFEVHEIRRQKLACSDCEIGVVVAPPVDKPIEQGRPGPGLLADVVTNKFVDHLPLYRISKRYARLGVDLADSTLGTWVAAVAEILRPLYAVIQRWVLGSHVLGMDDTHIKVLDRGHEGNIKRGHIWPYVGYDADGRRARVVYCYTPNWMGEGPRKFLAERQGYIQADGYKGINEIFRGLNVKVVRIGCWAHGRRKFKDALDAGDLTAAIPLKLIQRLYLIEERATELGMTAEQRRELRQEHAPPVLESLKAWLAATHPGLRPQSPLAKGTGYLIRQWGTLQVYLQDGAIPIDNNGVENLIRALAVGRKNWLFAGSDDAAERAAVIYSLLACCQLAKVEPSAWLRDTIEKLSSGWPQARIEELLPENYVPTADKAETTPATT